jgi:transcriptional regulator of acetoin/glycerol metabolism
MDEQLTVLYLSRKGLSAVATHDDLVATLGADAVSYPSVTHFLREAIFVSSNPPDPLAPPEHQLDESDQAILLALASQPFASIRELSRLTHLPRTTVHRRLTQSLRFRVRHLRWVPFFCHAVKRSIE